jgi:hypothetical protein
MHENTVSRLFGNRDLVLRGLRPNHWTISPLEIKLAAIRRLTRLADPRPWPDSPSFAVPIQSCSLSDVRVIGEREIAFSALYAVDLTHANRNLRSCEHERPEL